MVVKGFQIKAFLALVALLVGRAYAETHVSGHVRDAQRNAPIADAQIQFGSVATVVTSADGSYDWTGDCRDAPTCRVYASKVGYDFGGGAFDTSLATAVVDFSLDELATLVGQVRVPQGVSAAGRDVYELTAPFVRSIATTDDDGFYSVMVKAGSYELCAGSLQTQTAMQCFDHAAYPSHADQAEPIVLEPGEVRSGVDFDLTSGGSISGSLSDAFGPLSETPQRITLYNPAFFDSVFIDLTTDMEGRYTLPGISPGTYEVEVVVPVAFTDQAQLYPSVVCSESCDLTQGEHVAVAEGADAGGIDFFFHPAGVVMGQFRDSVSGTPVPGARMGAYYMTSVFPGTIDEYEEALSSPADANGNYVLRVRAPTAGWSYWLASSGATPHIDLPHPDQMCNPGPDCGAHGTSILIHRGDVLTKNIDLDMGAAIHGSVGDPTLGIPLAAGIDVYDADHNRIWSGPADAGGRFATRAWPPGTFFMQARYASACVAYLDRACPPSDAPLDSTNATPIVLALGEFRTIDLRIETDPVFRDGFDGVAH